MNALHFKNWLAGFIELRGQPPTDAQWEMIKEHLALVFNKVTGKRPNTDEVKITSFPIAPFRIPPAENQMNFFGRDITC